MECNSISYSFRVVSTKFEEKEMCQKTGVHKRENIDKYQNVMAEFKSHKFHPDFVRKLIFLKNNISSDEVEYCKRNLQYKAEAIFRLDTDSMSVTVMSSRLSFFDKMSAFGKID